MTHQVSQTTSERTSNGILCSMLLAAAVSGDTTYPVKEYSPPNIRAIAPELDELNQVKTLLDATTEATMVEPFDGSLPNTLQENHATSREIRDKIMAGIDRQLRLAGEEGDDDIAVSRPSKTGLFNFAKMQKITRPPFVVLRDNGNLSATWKFNDKDKFKLIFLKDGSLNYVAFLNKAGERDVQHENTDITGVMEFIQSNGIPL